MVGLESFYRPSLPSSSRPLYEQIRRTPICVNDPKLGFPLGEILTLPYTKARGGEEILYSCRANSFVTSIEFQFDDSLALSLQVECMEAIEPFQVLYSQCTKVQGNWTNSIQHVQCGSEQVINQIVLYQPENTAAANAQDEITLTCCKLDAPILGHVERS